MKKSEAGSKKSEFRSQNSESWALERPQAKRELAPHSEFWILNSDFFSFKYQFDTGNKVGLAATPFCVTSTSSWPEPALVGTWKLI